MKLAVVGLALALGFCGKDRGVQPTPIPEPTPETTPTATPQPPQTPMWTGNQFSPPLVGVAHCCDNPVTPADEGVRDGWSGSTPEAMTRDQIASGGRVNAIHLRVGTVKDSHPTYKSPQDVALACSFANSLGWLCEIDVYGLWSARRSPNSADGNRHGLTCEDARKTGAPREVKEYVELTVALTQSMHATYQTGNELWLCASNQNRLRSWERSIIDSIRAIKPNAVVGSNARTGAPGIDYYTIHGWSLENTEPMDPGIAVVWNESDNRFHTTGEYVEAAKLMYELGGHVIFWRGPLSDADWADVMSAIGREF